MNFANYLVNLNDFLKLDQVMSVVDGGVPSPIYPVDQIKTNLDAIIKAAADEHGLNSDKFGYRLMMDELYSAMSLHAFYMSKEGKLKYLTTVVFMLTEGTRIINDMSAGWAYPPAMEIESPEKVVAFMKSHTGMVINQELQVRTKKFLVGVSNFNHKIRIDLRPRDKNKPAMGDLAYHVETRPTRHLAYRMMVAEGRGVV